MTRSLTLIMALAAVFFTSSCVDEGNLNTWRDYEAGGDVEPESDDDDATPPTDDDDSRPDDVDDDDATEDEDPPRPDDDDVTPPADDDDTVSDDDDSLPSDDDDATEPPLPGDDDDSIPELPADADGDGYTEDVDCDDQDPAIHPGAPELCNGLDDNCSGSLPENDVDADEDGILECAGDCDDQDDTVYPGASEACNNQDDDCDGLVDEDCPPAWCPSGTVVDLVQNGGFESAEVFENWPLPGEGWGFEVSSMPTRVCSTSPVEPYEGNCYARLTGNSNGSQEWYMEQLQVVVDTEAIGLQSGDMILFSMAYRSTTAFEPLLQFVDDLNVADGLIAGGAWLEPPSSEDVWSTYSFGPASFTGNGDEWMRILLAYGDLATGEHVYVDDVTVEACLSP